ncbi:MAG TPA: gamma carbonic anhydrase family protein [Jatrophihabitantaceae bacterium]|jgi:carbonic anhydrase/acetyltransferase-like protein (isoleucine patch superfamily)|nr:gamma carbonic anhydrase family protein [Jatrophihabitantaceae bacterium]
MFLFEYHGVRPTIADDAYIAPTATIIGDVTVEARASVWYGAVLRGDDGPIIVREGANVQDGSVLHCPPGVTTEIGPGATVAHRCVIHGAVLEEESLVGNGCVVLDGARIGARSLIAAQSLVAAGAVIPPGVLAAGTPAVVKRELAGTPAELWVQVNPTHYPALAAKHRAGTRRIEH